MAAYSLATNQSHGVGLQQVFEKQKQGEQNQKNGCEIPCLMLYMLQFYACLVSDIVSDIA